MHNTRRRRAFDLAKFSRSLILLFCAVILCVFAYYLISSRTARDSVGMLMTRGFSPHRAFHGRESVNVLLLGRDWDRDNRDQIIHTQGRTDAMMLAHIDFRGRTASILSIPRDTLAHIPGHPGRRRINAANALGGPELAREAVAELTGVRADYYALVNLEGFEKAIDRMGGLYINVDKQLDYDDNWGNLHIHLKPGFQRLSGEQAMGFVRYRKSKDGDAETDLVRIGRQQEFLRALKKRLSSRAAFMRAPGILDVIRGNMRSDLSSSQQLCLLRFMRSVSGNNGVRMETLPALKNGGNYVRVDTVLARELIRQMFPEGAEP